MAPFRSKPGSGYISGKSGVAGYNDVTLIASLVCLAFHSVLLEAGHIREQLSLYLIGNGLALYTSYLYAGCLAINQAKALRTA